MRRPYDDDLETEASSLDVALTTVEADAAPEPSAREPVLFRVHGGKSGRVRSWRIDDDDTVVGRAAPAGGIPLSDDRSSRIHASLVRVADVVRVTNHSKKNGTFLLGARVEEAAVPDGGVLRFGDSVFVLRWAAQEDFDDARVPGFLGISPAVRAVRRQIHLVAPSDAWVLLLGETGTGKEVCARALHSLSGRKGPFVPVNCAAVPEALAESQLFGHRKGAFTGADADRDGFFQRAHGGTLFLDELGELPRAIQPKLLRALEERRVTRVGDPEARPVDVRVLAATNRDLARDVATGAFRGDLYARLADIVIELPPLRHRREDVLPLARALLHDDKRMSADLAERLACHAWPYNVRELAKVMKELQVRGHGREGYELSLVERRLVPGAVPLSSASQNSDDEGGGGSASVRPMGPSAARARKPPTRDELLELLQSCAGNVVEVARATGRSRKQVYRWFEKHGIDPAAFRGE